MTDSLPPLVVFDCMIFLQAAISPSGPAAACLRLVENGSLRLAMSQAGLDQIRDVLSRPKIRRATRALTPESIAEYLPRTTKLAPPRAETPVIFSYPRDPKDEPYLNLAIAEQATSLVSFD